MGLESINLKRKWHMRELQLYIFFFSSNFKCWAIQRNDLLHQIWKKYQRGKRMTLF